MERTLRNIGSELLLLRLDVGRSDDLAPFLGFLGEELAEIRGRHRQRHRAEVGQPDLYPWFRKGRVDFSVEPIDDFCRNVLGAAESDHKGRFVARQEIANDRQLWQRLGAHGRGHCQRAQLARLMCSIAGSVVENTAL